jgi:hypothetical protein
MKSGALHGALAHHTTLGLKSSLCITQGASWGHLAWGRIPRTELGSPDAR